PGDPSFTLTPGDDTGASDTQGSMRIGCADTAGWEYFVEATDGSGAIVASGACGAAPLAMNLEVFTEHTFSLYQRPAVTPSALTGEGWNLLLTRTTPSALSGCAVRSGSHSNAIVCADKRPETTFRVCWSTSPFASTGESGVTCEDFTINPGDPIRWLHSGLTNRTTYYYTIMAVGADGTTSGLYSTGSKMQGYPECPDVIITFTGENGLIFNSCQPIIF
ncbi:MAG: hypothetical protein HQK87_00475, partial [Nitrospinae bacterium]|nr:hypothetical protein [Nitrospinota bacterium]